jgi:hypothetical protein
MAGMGGIDPNILQQYLQRQQGGILSPGTSAGYTNPGQVMGQGPMIGTPETGPPPGMNPEAWRQGETYLDQIYQRAGQPRPGTSGPTGTDYSSWYDPNDQQGSFSRLFQGKDPSSQTLTGLAPYLQGAGWSLENPNAAGITSKIIGPDGQIVRVGNMFDAPGSQMSWGWTPQPTSRFQQGSAQGQPGPGGSSQNFMDDPSYQFMRDQGLQALQRSAAAKGTLLTGGTLKGLQRYAADYANNAYQGAFDRNLGVANLGLRAAGSLGELGSSYGRNAGNLFEDLGEAQASGTVGKTNQWLGALGGLSEGINDWYGSRRTNRQPVDYST